MKELTGLILDGARKVGEFETATMPDLQGFRDLGRIRLADQYMDVARGHTNQQLTFVFAAQGDGTFVVVDVLGHGMIFDPGSTWCGDRVVELDRARWVRTDEAGSDTN